MADLSRVESMQYPAGHLAHLSESQQKALAEFKNIIQDAKCYISGNSKQPASHDDETLLRYLRARRFVPKEAYKQFKDTEDWRKENKLGEIFNTIEVEEYEQTRRLYPQWLGRRDKRGIPLFLFEVAPLNTKNLGQYEKDLAKSKTTIEGVATKNIRLFALYESLTRFVTPLCSMVPRNHPETPISQSNNIVDISQVGLKQFWNLKAHMQDASVLATAHYPETLDRIFIVGAPSFFPTVWGWVKRWFDPITVSKIFILSPANVYSTLSQYIDHENIPSKYGGGLNFEFGQMPDLEPAILQQVIWENPNMQKGNKTFPIGPIRWQEGSNSEMQAWGVGSENGTPRKQLIFTIPRPIGYTMGRITAPITPAFQSGDPLTTVGTATHPPDTDYANIDIDTPPDGSDGATTPASQTSQPNTAATVATAPAQAVAPAPPPPTVTAPSAAAMISAAPPTTSDLPMRQGTSEGKFIQQDQTHAAGQLAEGTPEAATTHHSFGDKTVAVEPRTVGQAPKEIPVYEPGAPPALGYLEQAQSTATAVTSTVTSAVGGLVGSVVGGSKKEEPVPETVEMTKSPQEKETDRRIDTTKDESVEAFLREQSRRS